jgi:hypothetical protein
MNKNITKTESLADFIARGGEVKKVPTRNARKTYNKVAKEANLSDIDFSILPEALKIKYGIR